MAKKRKPNGVPTITPGVRRKRVVPGLRTTPAERNRQEMYKKMDQEWKKKHLGPMGAPLKLVKHRKRKKVA